MSWLPRSIANSLLIDGKDEDSDDRPTVANDDNNNHHQSVTEQESTPDEDGSDPQTLTSGVKEDLSELSESLARQFWGVASCLAPPHNPPPPPPLPPSPLRQSHRTMTQSDTSVPDRHPGDPSVSGQENGDSICEDSRFAGESGISNSSTFPNGNLEENDKDIVGVTDEVLSFATNIAHHPETWLDFPLSEEEDSDDFEMSDTQWNHATLVEDVVPRLAALRMELCPIHMSESYFWKVYFVLLHSRLNKHDAHLLSTPQIVAARSMWMKELQRRIKSQQNLLDLDFCATSSYSPSTTYNTEFRTNEPTVTEKLSQSGARVPSYTVPPVEDFGDDDEDDWIHDNSSELDGYNGSDIPVGAHEDISFSDLEDDDDDYDCTLPIRSKVI